MKSKTFKQRARLRFGNFGNGDGELGELLGELVIAVEARRGRPLKIAPPAMDSVKTWA